MKTIKWHSGNFNQAAIEYRKALCGPLEARTVDEDGRPLEQFSRVTERELAAIRQSSDGRRMLKSMGV